MSSGGSWTFRKELHMFVWPKGAYVQIYGVPHWQRRLAGARHDAHPDRVVDVSGFGTYEEFCQWCRNTNPWTGQQHTAPYRGQHRLPVE